MELANEAIHPRVDALRQGASAAAAADVRNHVEFAIAHKLLQTLLPSAADNVQQLVLAAESGKLSAEQLAVLQWQMQQMLGKMHCEGMQAVQGEVKEVRKEVKGVSAGVRHVEGGGLGSSPSSRMEAQQAELLEDQKKMMLKLQVRGLAADGLRLLLSGPPAGGRPCGVRGCLRSCFCGAVDRSAGR
jgi:hypothetical protein